VVTAPAMAALCITWEPPTTLPDGGVRVAFRTFAPLPGGGLRPWAVPDYPFRVSLTAPTGETRPLKMAPDERDRMLWVGSFTRAGDGPWTAQIDNFEEAQINDPACYEPLRIDLSVRQGLGSSVRQGIEASATGLDANRTSWAWPAIGAGVFLALMATAWVVWRRRMA
jgi:hypothetical protein